MLMRQNSVIGVHGEVREQAGLSEWSRRERCEYRGRESKKKA